MSENMLTYNEFKEALKQDRLLGLKCRECNEVTSPPRGVCGSCGSFDYDVVELKASGTVKTFTVIRVAPMGFKPPYIVGMLQLEEGPWLLGNIEGVSADQAGMDLIGRPASVSGKFFPPPDDENGVEGLAFSFSLND
jgi:uncharacterized protein